LGRQRELDILGEQELTEFDVSIDGARATKIKHHLDWLRK